MAQNVVKEKSRNFALRIIKLEQYLRNEKKEYVLSKQVLRSGTSVGANIHEAERGVSRRDFSNKMAISLKEASESEYWIKLLFSTGYLTESEYVSLSKDCVELIKILTVIVRKGFCGIKEGR